jgi:hypothetical protein
LNEKGEAAINQLNLMAAGAGRRGAGEGFGDRKKAFL